MNRAYIVIWNAVTNTWQVVTEIAKRHGKSKSGRSVTGVAAAVAFAFSGIAGAAPLPTGGSVVAGSGSISQSGQTMTVNQATSKMVVDWQSFSVGSGHTVNFVQPNANAVALNRVLGSDVSVIQGAINANGKVFLLNPNGVLFSPTAQVNVGSLVASTLNMTTVDFMAGNYQLTGGSNNAIVNQGNITAAGDGSKGGTITLIAAKVSNEGWLTADAGSVQLAAGTDVTLDLGGPVKLQISQGALDAAISNGGAVRADGGLVYLTAKALTELSSAVVNSTGVVRAQTLTSGKKGEILLLGDMKVGTLNVGGVLDASAPQGGDGGAIETSAANVQTLQDLQVNAGAEQGQGGSWLIDPYNYTINATAAGNIATALNTGTNVTVTTQSNNTAYGSTGSGSDSGDITVTSAITKSAGGSAALTLQADNSIIISAPISSTAGALAIKLSAANNPGSATGGVNVGADLTSNGGNILIGGAGGNQTTATSYGIGYALNQTTTSAAVKIGTGVTIQSGGGNITINGQSKATTSTYDATKAGVYVMSNATIDSGGGYIFISGKSTGDAKVFGFGIQGGSGTTTTFKTSANRGGIVVDAWNTLDSQGALGMVNNGSQAQVQFYAPNVAYYLFRINGNNQAAAFTQNNPCHPGYPYCGTMVIPGGNQSYTSAQYNVTTPATQAIYVLTGDGTKVYDGNATASNVVLSTMGGPNGFNVSDLGTLAFSTASKNVGSYSSLTPDDSNPGSYASGTYAVGYFNQGTYSITPKSISAVIGNKVYDGTTDAAVSSVGFITGDAVNFSYTAGNFSQKDAGSDLNVSVTGITLSGTDAANYSLSGGTSLTGTADIIARSVDLSGARVYDGSTHVGNNIFTLGNLVGSETLTLSGEGTVADKNIGTGKVVTTTGLSLGNGSNGGLASNYTFVGGTQIANITPAQLTVSGLTANDKVYNGTLAATLSGTAVLAGTIYEGDGVSLSGSASSGSFGDKNVGDGKSVSANLDGLSLNNGNYQIAGVTTALTANITPAQLTVSGLTANDKVYNGTLAATLSGTAVLAGTIYEGDGVSLSGSASSGSFGDKNVGDGKSV
ncbi:YDG domain-containing protein, partial [Vogesella indigofera]|uniref:YDG domain-containing protein n=1 Tax=Vogesella indigofera TaxID=45465 RepID=UPI00234FB5D3